MASFVAGSVVAKFLSDLSGLQQGISAAKGAIGSLKDAAGGIKDKFESTFGGVTGAVGKLGTAITAIGGLVGGISIAGLGKQALDAAKDFEQSEIAFTTLLKDRGKAIEAINQITEDAKATPYNLPELIKANQMLISAGVSTQDARVQIRDLGNAIAATGGGTAELSRLSANLQQIKAVGKASAMDIKQFAFAGINVYQMLADVTGKNVEQVKDMDVSYELLTKAFAHASAEGGMFAGAMENQSASMQGIISNLQDMIGIGLKDILVESGGFDAIKNMLMGLAGWLQESIPKITRFFSVVGGLFSMIGEILGGQDLHAEITEAFSFFTGEDRSTGFGKAEMIASVFESIVKAVGGFVGFLAANKETIMQVLTGIGIALGAIMAVQGVITVIGAIGAAIAFLLSPVGLVIAAITLLYLAWTNNFLGIQDIVKGVISFLGNAFEWLQSVPGWIAEKWQQFQDVLSTVVTAVGEILNQLWQIVMAILQPIIDYVMFWANFWKWIFDNILFPVIYLLAAIVARIVVEVYNFFVWLGDQINAVFDWINNNIIQPAINFIVEKFTWLMTKASEIWNSILDTATRIWESIKSGLMDKTEGARTGVSNTLNALKDFVAKLFNDIWQGIVSIGEKIKEAIVSPFRWAKEEIEKIAQGIKDAADKISPFHKNSPSLVELVEAGTEQIANSYARLNDAIGMNDFKASVMTYNQAGAGFGGSGSPTVVNQEVTNIINDQVDVDFVNQRLEYMFRNAQ